MSRSEIFAINTTSGSPLAIGATYVPTNIVRRFGPNVALANNGITIEGSGYYNIDATVTVALPAAGTVTATLYLNGSPISGATATQSGAANAVVTLPLTAVVRMGCNCMESTITVVMSEGASTSNNLAIRVEKV